MLLNYLNTVQLGKVLESFNGYLDTLKTMKPMANGLEVNYTQRPQIIRMFKTYLGPQFNSYSEAEQKLFLHDLYLETRLDKVLFREFGQINGEKADVLESLTVDFLLMFPRRSLVVFEGDEYHLDYETLPTVTASIQHEQLLTNVRFAAIAKDTMTPTVDPLVNTEKVINQTNSYSPSVYTSSFGTSPIRSDRDYQFASEQEQLAGSDLPGFTNVTTSSVETDNETETTITTNEDGSYSSTVEYSETIAPKKQVTKRIETKEELMNTKTERSSINAKQPDPTANDFAFNQKRKSESGAKRGRGSASSGGQKKKKSYMKQWASAAVVSAISTAIGVPSLVTILNSVN